MRIRNFVALLSVALPMAALLFLLLWPAPAVQLFRYTDHEPRGWMRTQFIEDVFFPAVEKESEGRLKIKGHWNGELSISYDALRTIGEAISADMGIVVPEYTAKELPLHQIFKSFPTGPAGDKQVDFFRRVYAEVPEFLAELEKNNVVPLLLCTGFPVTFFSVKPLRNLEDIRGGTWRAASFWHQDYLRNAGANAVTMPWGEKTYKALQDGEIDGLMVNVDSGYALEAHKIAPNTLISQNLWLGHIYLLVMNKNTWDGLAEEEREAFRRAAETAYKTLGSAMENNCGAMMEYLRDDGATVRVLEPEELKQWEEATRYREAQAAWVKKQEDAGEAGAVMEKVSAIRVEYYAE
jgi:TRAP-type C4-dicarboxylate transport system substrate-binding protein